MSRSTRIVVIGAGPTGLGAAWRLNELQHPNWDLYESSDRAGGLASSVVDDRGFTWDMGGHVLFSHYKYFDRMMIAALDDAWIDHIREAWVWMRNRWIPYPLQNNIWRLPGEELIACLEGLLAVRNGHEPAPPKSFADWLLAGFGQGLCQSFMFPYNRKVWAYHPCRLDVGWMGERVATVDLARVLRNLVLRKDDVGWGPNSTFRFPRHGGTGAIWRAICGKLPADRIHFNHTVMEVRPSEKTVVFDDGTTTRYDALISTMPLDVLLRRLAPAAPLRDDAGEFVHSSSHIIGIGLAGRTPDALKTKCWMYFPEDDLPFYRTTVFSNYSPNNVADPRSQWSLMAEVSESPDKPVDTASVVSDVIDAFVRCGFIQDPAAVVSTWHRRLEHGYPTPWLGRDAVLERVDRDLRAQAIFSRGRFGAWKYEVSNQDHSTMQGVEAVDHLLAGKPERTYHGEMSD
jgi:protoporphyrinogen oxidase